jgi:hypothetical protein
MQNMDSFCKTGPRQCVGIHEMNVYLRFEDQIHGDSWILAWYKEFLEVEIEEGLRTWLKW